MTHSIASRFSFSLGANLLKALVGFVTGMLVARGLGPVQYGNMMFLMGTFTALRQLLDVGSSTAFFTFLSQRQRSKRFVIWFFAWLGLQFLVPLLAAGLLFPESWVELIWKGEQRSLVVMALVASFMQSTLWSVMMQMGESQRLTRLVQGVSVGIALLHLLLMAISWWQEWLGIRLIFVALAFEWAFAAYVIAKQMRFPLLDENEKFMDVLKEFWHYCRPLIPYSWLGFVYEFADRWLLQNYGGSVQQAFYAVALQWSAVASIATLSIVNVLWKEIAEANHQGNKERVAMIYRKASRGLFFIAASAAGFLVPWSEYILRISLGPAYAGGAAAFAVMLFYPLFESMGHVGGAMLYTTGRVHAQVVIGMLFMIVSIVATYFVLAPVDASLPGFGLGAIGLASKRVVMAFLMVNAIAFYLARSLQIRLDWVYQPLSGLGCLATGWLTYSISQRLFDLSGHILLGMLIDGLLYLFMMVCMVWLAPSIAGVSRSEILVVVRRVADVCASMRTGAG